MLKKSGYIFTFVNILTIGCEGDYTSDGYICLVEWLPLSFNTAKIQTNRPISQYFQLIEVNGNVNKKNAPTHHEQVHPINLCLINVSLFNSCYRPIWRYISYGKGFSFGIPQPSLWTSCLLPYKRHSWWYNRLIRLSC